MGKRAMIAAAAVLVVGTAGASATYGRGRSTHRLAVARPATVRHVPPAAAPTVVVRHAKVTPKKPVKVATRRNHGHAKAHAA